MPQVSPISLISPNLLMVQACSDQYMNSTTIMIQSDMQPLAIPTGGIILIFLYLHPPLGAGTQPTIGGSNHIITRK